jgi:glucokinase
MSFGLVADIGGTFIRLGHVQGLNQSGHMIHQISISQTKDCTDFGQLAAQYLRDHGLGHPSLGLAVGFAGDVIDGVGRLTNGSLTISADDLAQRFKVPAHVVNDFEAIARALPYLRDNDLEPLAQDGLINGPGRRLVIGPGTGLGCAGLLVRDDHSLIVTPTEAGHVSLAPANPRELRLLDHWMKTGRPIYTEAILSGPGLIALYLGLAALDGIKVDAKIDGAAILAAARAGQALALETVQQFSAWLGAYCGDMALAQAARCGLFLTGGILDRLGDLFDRPGFRARFLAKGKQQAYLGAIPIHLIRAELPALIGLAGMLAKA